VVKTFLRKARIVALIAGGLLLVALPAFATDPDPATVVGGAASDLKSNLLQIGVTVLPYAAIVLALTLGWRFARKFVRG
jgi:phosphotransferase system  glucose/maltose/N-acetylglucosamine-specific IIC component